MFRISLVLIAIAILSVGGCKSGSEKSSRIIDNEIIQKKDGRILLNLKDAYLLSDEENPDNNTAEWNFEVLSKGRYEVWLSSLTKDTMNLTYNEPVIVHFGDKRLEGQPVGNEIVLNDDSVSHPYFRADSKLGSILIENVGHYNLQVISEKVLPMLMEGNGNSASTILDQIVLKPQLQ